MGEGYEEGDEIPEKDHVIIIVKVYFEVAKEVGGSEPEVWRWVLQELEMLLCICEDWYQDVGTDIILRAA